MFVHSADPQNTGAAFILAYFINNLKQPLKSSIGRLQSIGLGMEISNNFLRQLEQYDLERLAMV